MTELRVYPSGADYMKALSEATERAIKKAAEENIDACVNWGDLHCIDVGWKISLYDRRGQYYVLIEEGDPCNPKFSKFIYDELAKEGFHNVEVSIEW